MNNNIESDINLARGVLSDNPNFIQKKLYFETNEHIIDILDNFDIKNKKILCVVGSGDQAFHFYNRGAKKVDLFDINNLTIYYYYLRMWTIIYLKKSYPPYNFNSDFLLNLISMVTLRNNNEVKALKFWYKFANLLNELNIESKNLFCDSIAKRDDSIFNNTNLMEIISKKNFKFYNINIAEDIRIPHKYDIIYTSNVTDYVETDSSFNLYRLNLKKLLKKDGIVISSRLDQFLTPGIEVVSKSFIYHDLPKIDSTSSKENIYPGYYYTKKR